MCHIPEAELAFHLLLCTSSRFFLALTDLFQRCMSLVAMQNEASSRTKSHNFVAYLVGRTKIRCLMPKFPCCAGDSCALGGRKSAELPPRCDLGGRSLRRALPESRLTC